MNIENILTTAVVTLLSTTNLLAQRQWTLKECIEYATEHNISIQKMDVINQQNEISLNTAQNDRLPYIYGYMSGDMYFGRGPSRDGTYTDNNQAYASASLVLTLPIYEGSRIKNTIVANKLNLKASIAQYDAAKEDLSLQIVTLYIQVLYSKELCCVAENQLELSSSYTKRSRLLLENGKVSEGDYYESLSLQAKDELNLTEVRSGLTINILNLAQALNLEQNIDFDIATPDTALFKSLIVAPLTSSQTVYDYAVENRPEIKTSTYTRESLEYQRKVAKSAIIPTISLSGGYYNSYYNSFIDGVENTIFKEQLKLNGNQIIGLSISIPIFNKFASRNNIKQSALSIKNQELEITNQKQQLYKDIEQAYQNAKLSRERYVESIKSLESAQKAFEYAKIKADEGKSTVFDFNDSKNRLISSESDLVKAKYEYIFNKKILDFYNGEPLY